MSGVVLVTGVSRYLGARVAAQLAADPSVDRVIGIDTAPPGTADLPLLGRTEFVRADIRNPLIAKVVGQARVTTVVHAALMSSPRALGGRTPMQEMNVIGSMQLLAACQKSDTVERVVVRSSTAVYGSSARDPAVFTEPMHPGGGGAQRGFAKDAVEVEGYVRGFLRRRPDIDVSVLRIAPMIGPTVHSAVSRYLQAPVAPSVFGFDPRLQLVHESDAVEVLRLAAAGSRPGVFNVAGDGIVTLSQLVRRARRVRLPLPTRAIGLAGSVLGNSGVVEFAAENSDYLDFGRVVDTTRLRTEFGYEPRYTTAAAIDSMLDPARPLPRLAQAVLGVGSGVLELGRRGGPALADS